MRNSTLNSKQNQNNTKRNSGLWDWGQCRSAPVCGAPDCGAPASVCSVAVGYKYRGAMHAADRGAPANNVTNLQGSTADFLYRQKVDGSMPKMSEDHPNQGVLRIMPSSSESVWRFP